MKPLALTSAAVVLGVLVGGCEAPPAKAPSRHERVAAGISRAAAIHTARRDAALRFGEGWIAWIDVAQLGRYWVIELGAQNGTRMRYAISLRDGSIRERSIFQ